MGHPTTISCDLNLILISINYMLLYSIWYFLLFAVDVFDPDFGEELNARKSRLFVDVLGTRVPGGSADVCPVAPCYRGWRVLHGHGHVVNVDCKLRDRD